VSDWEQIFFDAGEPLEPTARVLATALSLNLRVQESSIDVWGGPSTTGLMVSVFGSIEINDYAETAPETVSDRSIFDDMPFVFELRVGQSNLRFQAEVAALLHRRMSDALGWRSALTSGFVLLRATYDDVHGYREFPAETLSDATHADRWR
jgi:hypothetical protein